MGNKRTWGGALFVLGVALATAAVAFADTSTFSLEDGSVRFRCEGPEVEHSANGRFATVTSRLVLDPTDLSEVEGEVQVMLTSITTDESEWDIMFRRAPFLGIDEFPRATFELERVEGARELRSGHWTSLRLVGRFTVHGVSVDKRAEAMAYWEQSSNRLLIRARTSMRWDEHEINMPEGRTRTFAGDGADLYIALDYRLPTRRGRPVR